MAINTLLIQQRSDIGVSRRNLEVNAHGSPNDSGSWKDLCSQYEDIRKNIVPQKEIRLRMAS